MFPSIASFELLYFKQIVQFLIKLFIQKINMYKEILKVYDDGV
jgi:hypothetical protein